MKSYNQILKIVDSPLQATDQQVDISTIIHKQMGLPIPIVKKGIKQDLLTIDNKKVLHFEVALSERSVVKFQDQTIHLDIFKKEELNHFDRFITVVNTELSILDINNIRSDVKNSFCALVIEYFCNFAYDSVTSTSKYFDLVFLELELFYREYFRESRELRVPKRKELIEGFIKRRTDKLRDLTGLIENLINGTYSKNLYRFLQEYNKLVNHVNFIHCIGPTLTNTIFSKPAIESLIKPVSETHDKSEIDQKYDHFESCKEVFLNYLSSLDEHNEIHIKLYYPLGNYLFSLLKKECQTLEVKNAFISVASTSRKYNFKNPDRTNYDIFFRVENTGEGLGREILLESLSDSFNFQPYKIGVLKPNEIIDISISAEIQADKDFDAVLKVKCIWQDNSSQLKEHLFKIQFQIQDDDIPWEILENDKPYTIQEIEDKEKLYGRDEILRELASNIRSSNVESYKIWGQKRVGKSSIVRTLKSLFNNDEKILVVLRSIAGLKNTDPIQTLNTLGESLCGEIFEEIDSKIKNPSERERLRAVEVPEFNGSLYPLETYLKKLRRIDLGLKFVIILDEFDRINEEFFLPGNLGDTFSLNIGKGLSSNKHVGFILVGSENMHLLDRQEINYNSFQGREIDTFNKKTEYESFKNIITGPVFPYINYSIEAIELIFAVTNGNPYFANLICSHIFKICLGLKDNDVDVKTVKTAIDFIVDSSQKAHFEHFWGDGITDESNIKKEKKADIRRRVLVSYSFVFFQTNVYPTRNDIIKSFKKPLEYVVENYEIENTITEFFNRKIFYDEENSHIRIKPSLFESWLCGPGRTLMIEGVSDLEALQREKQLEREHSLKQEEYNRIINSYTFKGHQITQAEIVKYFNQFGGPLEQRRIFKIIDSIYYIGKNEIQDFFKQEQKNIFRKTSIEMRMGARTPFRENVELYSFPTTLEDNEDLAETFKVLSHIRSTKTIKDLKSNKDAWKQNAADDIIIFDSIISDFSKVRTDLVTFLEDKQLKDKATVKLIVLIITTKAKADLIKATSGFHNFKLIHFKEVEENKIKPFIPTTEVFETYDESSYAFAEVKKHIGDVTKDALNIVFESYCPGRSLPILWYRSVNFQPLFSNERAVLNLLTEHEEKEKLRTRLFHTNRELSQKLNLFIVEFLKEKAAKDGKAEWLRVEYLPNKVLTEITTRWIEEGQVMPQESYMHFIHYKEIIKKNKELLPVFQIGNDGFGWCDRLNVLRRDPAHPEKPAPSLEDVEYFEKMSKDLIKRMNTYTLV